MRIARFNRDGETKIGVVQGESIAEIEGDVFGEFSLTDKVSLLQDVSLLAPVQPPNIIAIGLNYARHAQEVNAQFPVRPVIFIKATTSIIGPMDKIVLPTLAGNEVDYEAELAIVIGKRAKNVEVEEALQYVLGYTCANDVSARDCQKRLDIQWARGKSFDTFCPLGPWIETELDPCSQEIQARLNGQVVQRSSTADMIFSVPELISYCSKNMTLLPGTVILTGTPEGVGAGRKPPLFLRDGDLVEIEIGDVGVLTNRVSKES